MLAATLLYIPFGAGFGEETFFRGYLFERLGRLFGNSRSATFAIVILTAALFGAAHYPGQSWDGVLQGCIIGVIFGSFFAVTKQLFPLMIAHAAFDFTAVAIIAADLEWKMAHLVFK